MNEKDLLNRLQQECNDVQIPDSLTPEAIEKKLKLVENQKKQKSVKRNRLYRNCGLIAASLAIVILGINSVSALNRGYVNEETEANGKIETAESYDQLYDCIKDAQEEYGGGEMPALFNFFGAGSVEEAAVEESMDMAAAPMDRGMATGAGGDYSTTNVRQEGVDEADIAKTDGRYLYVLKDNGISIAIVDTEDGMKEVGEIMIEENNWIEEFYMLPEEQKLIIVNSKYLPDVEGDEAVPRALWYTNMTEVLTYDVSDVKNPKLEGSINQSGGYASSRLSDGHLYLFSNFHASYDIPKDKPEAYVPAINDEVMTPADIYMSGFDKASSYMVITSVDVQKPDKIKDSKALFAESGEVYVSSENIYYYETVWGYEQGSEDKTSIRKISYKDGKLEAVAKETIPGYINDSFSIDEYEGYLRIVATVGETNSVYVLDKDLEMTGSIEGLAEDERVYSARFMGATGYFVTFRETDPLFTVDLSNPKAPKIIGKLKIPGFSDYLHFYGEDKLLGIGMEVDEETGVSEGAKLTMFDISDRADVKEESTYIMKNVYSTDVEYDYKAALIDVEKNLIGFAGYPEGRQCYYIFSYDEDEGFICKMEEDLNGNASRSARGIYIDQTLYVVQGNVIESYSLYDYKKIDDLIL